MLVSLKDWAELDGPPIALVVVMLARDMWREYLRARYGASPSKQADPDKQQGKE